MKHGRWIATTVALAATASISAYLGIRFAVPQVEELRNRNNELKMENVSLGRRLENVEQRGRMAVREARMLRQANALIRAEEQQRLTEIASLNADLDLYRRLGGATGSQEPLVLRHAEWVPGDSEGSGELALTLTQNLRYAKDTTGNVSVQVVGLLDGAPATLGWDAFGAGQPAPEFAFKYFQLLELPLQFPPGFDPTRLEVSLEAEGGARFEVAYAWQDLSAPGGEGSS